MQPGARAVQSRRRQPDYNARGPCPDIHEHPGPGQEGYPLLMLPKTKGTFSSWWLTVLLLLCLGATYLYFSFGEKPFDAWINFVFFSAPGALLYAALIANILSASVRVVFRRLRHVPAPAGIMQMDVHEKVPLSGDDPSGAISGWMNKRGFRTTTAGNIISGTRGRFSFLPGTIFRSGLIIMMVALFFSSHLRRTAVAFLHDGDEKVFFGNRISVTDIRSNIPAEFLAVGEKSTFRLDNISSGLKASGKTYRISGGFPSRIDGLYYRIVDTGFTQPVSLKTPAGEFQKNL